MTSKKIFLDTSETLKRIGEALPPGHSLLVAAKGAESSDRRQSGIPSVNPADRFRAAPGWSGEIGVLFSADGRDQPSGIAAILWIRRSQEDLELDGGTSASQFTLDLASARYKIEYWRGGEGRLVGVEIGLGPRLVLSPPEDSALVASVEVLSKIDKRDGSV
jgi:hypothetical protein